jgi:glutamine amidotransferase
VTRITIFDYGAGNLHSLAKALALPGTDVRIERDPRAAIRTDALVLPGVGAFTPAAQCLADASNEVSDAILNGLPTLGICLGMQLLFEGSEEGPGAGLGVFRGQVRRLRAARVPHIGWNAVAERVEWNRGGDEPLTYRTVEERAPDKEGAHPMAYFANGYVCEPEDETVVMAYTTHESDRFASMVGTGNTVGVQFHPEKSSAAGVAFLQRFVRSVTR